MACSLNLLRADSFISGRCGESRSHLHGTRDMNRLPPARLIYARLPPIDDRTSANLLLPKAQCDYGNPQVREKFPLLSYKTAHLPLSGHVPCAPTDICSSWHTIISYHLKKKKQKNKPGREAVATLFFIWSSYIRQQQGWWSCQLKPSLNLQNQPQSDIDHHVRFPGEWLL